MIDSDQQLPALFQELPGGLQEGNLWIGIKGHKFFHGGWMPMLMFIVIWWSGPLPRLLPWCAIIGTVSLLECLDCASWGQGLFGIVQG